jgi:hypothetical protein
VVHFLLDHIFTINHNKPTIKIEDQLLNATLFTIGVEWCALIIKYLKKWCFDDDIPKEERNKIVIKSNHIHCIMKNYTNWGQNNIVHQCLLLIEGVRVFVDSHERLAFWY